MKKLLQPIALLTVGFAFGVITTCYLSMRASSSFLELARLNYQMEQHIKAIRANKFGDLNQAVIHYANLAEASSFPGLYCFSKTRKYWSMSFPITSLMLEKISKGPPNKSAKEIEAINRAMFAAALEKSGRTEEAMSEYSQAANLLGFEDDIARVKKLVKEVTASDDALLELEDQYIYPQNVK